MIRNLNANPVALDKETIARLDEKQLQEIMGGFDYSNNAYRPTKSCGTGTTSSKTTPGKCGTGTTTANTTAGKCGTGTSAFGV